MAVNPPMDIGWIPPANGQLKMNCAAKVDKVGVRVGIGVVIRDFKEDVLACCSHTFQANYSAKTATLVSILKGLQFDNDCGFSPDAIEVDNEEVIKLIKNGLHKDSEFGAIIDDILKLTFTAENRMFRSIHRLANKAAYALALYSYNLAIDAFWLVVGE
ncbi:hypothetical protein QYF36_008360 [Acer negundo]|nr:hypothetical protein QYF36_008360 [Acer negundo]